LPRTNDSSTPMTRRGRTPSGMMPWLMLSLLIVGLDQLTKLMVVNRFAYGESLEITGFFNLVYVLNTGAAFSFLSDAGGWQRWFFVALALGITGFLVVMLRKGHQQPLFATSASLIIGGAIGNLIDRLATGAVVDFIDLHVAGWHWPAFNIADSAITVGAVLFILDEFRRVKREAPK